MDNKDKSRILIVDDEPALLELLNDSLQGEDRIIDKADNGHDAIVSARKNQPDLLVTDLMLGDCTGIEVIDCVRADCTDDVPAIVITGHGDPEILTEASRWRPVELMTKPLDIPRLQEVVTLELSRKETYERTQTRTKRLRRLAREFNIERKSIKEHLNSACADLTAAYRTLSGQMAMQQVLIAYQRELITSRNDDDVFRSLFRLMVHRSGPVYGIAMVCDSEAELQVAGRFGVPKPDELEFCTALAEPVITMILAKPQCMLLDAGDDIEMFDESIRRYLPGISVLAIPLIPAPGELIGMIMLYRKGEQPFTDADLAVAEMVSSSTAAAVRRND